jgi:phosphatidylglycerol:prolipoprotein diacylglycerol transferase
MATVDPSYNPPSHIYDAGSPGDNSNIAFSLFGLQVAWYGIFIFIGFFVAIILICLKLKFIYKVSIDPFYYFCVIGIPSAILFARIGSCIINDAQ